MSTTGRRCPPNLAGYPHGQGSASTRRVENGAARLRVAHRSVSVDELPNRRDLASQLVVDGGQSSDLVAGMEDGRVIAAAELGADPKERDVGFLAHEEHRDLA